jgi:ubiquinone/menaquinone biosynthesis C-methylase UbiE
VTESSDRWHKWLLDVRHGGDVNAREQDLAQFLYPVRDKVLDRAELGPDATLLDVGVGDGLIAFGALDRLGPAGRVILSDISQDLLNHCRKVAEAEGLLDQCRFITAAADALEGIADASVDVVTTRSVLIYVKEKAAAFREFYRVLRPGGRVSLFEPINVLMGGCDPGQFYGYDIRPVAALAAKVGALYESIQPPGKDPMGDFDERDLVRHAEQAGFPVVDLELHLAVKNTKQPVPWERFLRMSGNPLIPPTGEAIDRTLSPDEIAEFTAHLRPLVEAGTGQERRALAYLTATKAQ